MKEKWVYAFARYEDGSFHYAYIASTIKGIKPSISSTGFVIFRAAEIKNIYVVIGDLNNESLKQSGAALCYNWQAVDSLEEAKHELIKGILFGISFNSITNHMENKPF